MYLSDLSCWSRGADRETGAEPDDRLIGCHFRMREESREGEDGEEEDKRLKRRGGRGGEWKSR